MFRLILAIPVALAAAMLFPASPAAALTPEEKAATLRYVQSLQSPETGGFSAEPGGKPALAATSAAIRTLKYLGAAPKDAPAARQFLLSCYSDGTFAPEPGKAATVGSSSVGLMAYSALLGKDDPAVQAFGKAVIAKLAEEAAEFEEVRIAGAAAESVGLAFPPAKRAEWLKMLHATVHRPVVSKDGQQVSDSGGDPAARARLLGGALAAVLRLDPGQTDAIAGIVPVLKDAQRPDGGWAATDHLPPEPGSAEKKDEKAEKKEEKAEKAEEKKPEAKPAPSDLETTYRVMRALHMSKAAPKDVAKLRAFVASCRHADGGYSVKAGGKPNVAGTYYALTILGWLPEEPGK